MEIIHLIISYMLIFIYFSFPIIVFIGIYIIAKSAYNTNIKIKLEKIDFKNNNFYYRDILSKYSIGNLSYIDDFKLDKSDIIATLLNLELKNKIKIEEKIKVMDDNIEDLKEDERYILKNLAEKNLKKINMIEYENIIQKNCKEKGLLKTKNLSPKKIKIMLSILLFLFVISILLIIFNIAEKFLFFYILLEPAFFFYTCIFIIMNAHNPYIRTKEGKMLNKKIEGLKKIFTKL